MNAAIYFHPEAYTTTGPKLMGRNAAGESFLRGFLAYSRNEHFWVQVQKPEHAQSFAAVAQAAGRTQSVTCIDKNSLGALAQPGIVYHPGPGIGAHAWQRSFFAHSAWSLCGITHTTSSAGAMDAIAEWLTAPVQPWDAVICTSTAVRDNVQRLLQAQADYLVQRMGISRVVLPELPVIPLGIHTSDFAFSDTEREAARIAINADGKTHVVLFTGRLSFHAKAHPLAMYQALEKAAATLPEGETVVLVECGWHANDFIKKAYEDAAMLACPSVRVIGLDGRKPQDRQIAWASADVFCSLSDNIQETFGIVPIEAMASGLPVVVSDWDGYKDTVRDGVDGFRIPTTMPHAGLGSDLALRHALEIDTYDMYCGHSCMLVAIDIDAASEAFGKLFASEDLRRSMGEAGRQRAREVYDWARIIPQYEALWSQLAESRLSAEAVKSPYPCPTRMDPFSSFESYPTRLLTAETRLALTDLDADLARKRLSAYRQLAMVNFAKLLIPEDTELDLVLVALNDGAKTATVLLQPFPAERQAFVFRSFAWLLKSGILKVAP